MRQPPLSKLPSMNHPQDIAHKISAHGRQRLLERLNCKHPIRHIAKVRKEGTLLQQTPERYVLRRNLEGNPELPVDYCFSSDGWLLTAVPKWRKGALEQHAARKWRGGGGA